MTLEGRIRISLTTGELEIEGSSEFVKLYDEAISDMLERLVSQPFSSPEGDETGSDGGSVGGSGAHDVDSGLATDDQLELGEALHALAKNSTGTDKILVAAWYAQKASSENDFTTLQANKLLVEQGIKLTNAAQCVKQNVSAKRVFKVRGNRWRISQAGMEHLSSIGIR